MLGLCFVMAMGITPEALIEIISLKSFTLKGHSLSSCRSFISDLSANPDKTRFSLHWLGKPQDHFGN